MAQPIQVCSGQRVHRSIVYPQMIQILHWYHTSIPERVRLQIHWDDLNNWILNKFYRYALVIPTILFQSPFWQDLARCHYFETSVEIVEADIFMVVGDTWTALLLFLVANFNFIDRLSRCKVMDTVSKMSEEERKQAGRDKVKRQKERNRDKGEIIFFKGQITTLAPL